MMTHPQPPPVRPYDAPDVWAGRHPSTAHFAPLFDYAHLPPELQAVSGPCGALAEHMLAELPDGVELTVGLRKLLEAKDSFVRHTVKTIRDRQVKPDSTED